MAILSIPNVTLCGVSACVPQKIKNNSEEYGEGYDSFLENVGIEHRRFSEEGTCASDLCFKAAETLISDLSWDKNDIGLLVFVSQTRDYILPATSCILQDRLGLSKDCMTLDVSLGCSGWVHGLSVVSSIIQTGYIKKALLLVGDTITKHCWPNDKSAYPLFGDAGTATALQYEKGAAPISFNMHTDGADYETIIIRDGGYRNRVCEESFIPRIGKDGNERRAIDNEMDGMSVFSFGITKVPKAIKELLKSTDREVDDIDYVVLHQANKMMNEMICKKIKVGMDKAPVCFNDFGNTSCASIPLTMVVKLRDQLTTKCLSLLTCGFGVGLSWGVSIINTDRIVVPDLIEY